MKNIFLIILSFILFSCVNNSNQTKENMITVQTDTIKSPVVEDEVSQYHFVYGTLHFFGHQIDIGDSAYVMERIKEIAQNDTMLTLEDTILKVCDVRFGINMQISNLNLYSFIASYDPQLTPVVEYITGIYGTPEMVHPDDIWWYEGRSAENDNYGTLVTRLCPVRAEDDCTAILFY